MHTDENNEPDYALARRLAADIAASMDRGLDLHEISLRLVRMLYLEKRRRQRVTKESYTSQLKVHNSTVVPAK